VLARDPLLKEPYQAPHGFWASVDRFLLPLDRAQKALILDPNRTWYPNTCSVSPSKDLLAGRMGWNSFFSHWQIEWKGVGHDILAQDPGARIVPASPKQW
jgi:hypothetical protein